MQSVSQPKFVFRRCSGEPGGTRGAHDLQDKKTKQLVAVIQCNPVTRTANLVYEPHYIEVESTYRSDHDGITTPPVEFQENLLQGLVLVANVS